jgi:hypothetical protein
MGSGSERLGGSDVGKPGCSSYRSVLSFRGPEAEQGKLESLVPAAPVPPAPEYGVAVTVYVPGVVRKAQAYILNAGGYCQGFPK